MQVPVLQAPSAIPNAVPAAVPTPMAALTPAVPVALPMAPVISQPQPQVVLNVQTGPQSCNPMGMLWGGPLTAGPLTWSTGLFQCCDDIPICLLGCLCPITFPCYLSALFGEMCCLGMLPGAMFALRTGVRERYKIPGDLLNDYCAICCCLVCALCQMAREIKVRERHNTRLPRPRRYPW
ncbi:cornifelin homolog A-like [Leptodactylus fuscus]